MSVNVKFKVGTQSQYDSILEKDSAALYWLTDTQRLYKGSILFAVGKDATAVSAGLLSAEDKAKLDALVTGTITEVKAADNTIFVTKDGTEVSIKLNISEAEGNLLAVDEDGKVILKSDDVKTVVEDAIAEGEVEVNAANVTVGEGEDAKTLEEALEEKQDALEFATAPSETNKVVTQADIAALEKATHFVGVVESLDDITDPKAGDIAIVGTAEFIYNGSEWQELGNEGIYATKEELEAALAAEEEARAEAIAAEVAAREEAIEAEATAREEADEALSKRIDDLYMDREPELIDMGFYANGVSVRFTDDGTQNVAHYLITDKTEKTINVPYGATIYGGSLGTADKFASYDSALIVIEGGQYKSIYAGSCEFGSVAVATVIINGGKITSGVMGSGYGGKNGDLCQVGKANVVVNGGEIYLLYGGSHGYATVSEVYLEVNGGTHQYVTLGGSNGSTGIGKAVINGGNIKVFQTVNRGYLESAEVTVTGGTIVDMYAGGETGDSSVTGRCEKADLRIESQINGTLHKGTYGGVEDASRCFGYYYEGTLSEEEAQACNLVLRENIAVIKWMPIA